MRLLFSLLLPALLLAACAPAVPVAPTASSDVRLGGTSILGTWNVIGAPDQADVDRDIRSGMFTQTLIVNPYGRVTLTGEDRRAGTGRVSFEGRLNGDRLTLEGRPGAARLALRNASTIEMTDPRGNRTVYRRR